MNIRYNISPRVHPYVSAVIGFLGMSTFYGGLLWLTTGDALHPAYFFLQKWYFLTPMFLGFSYQMFLFQRLRFVIHENQLKMAGTSAGVSGLAMVACCAHHVSDFLPFVGVAGVAGGISKYQDIFLGMGVAINAIGIWYMQMRLHKQKNMPCATDKTVNN